MRLRTEPYDGFRPDEVYAKLISIGAGKDDRSARQAMAAVLLLLINHVGDEQVVDEAISMAANLPPASLKTREEADA